MASSYAKPWLACGILVLSGCDSGDGTTGGGGPTTTTIDTTGGGGAGATGATGGAGGSTGGTGGAACQPGEKKSCYGGPAGTENVGACKPGEQICKANGEGFGPCMGEVTPQPETCATLVDDDCNGMVNEGGEGCECIPGSTAQCYSGPADTEGVGSCKSGTQVCEDGTGFGPCTGEIAPKLETCDTPEDDDCDGKTNEDGEGCACPAGELVDCYTGPNGTLGVGECKGGLAQCSADGKSLGPCEGQTTPAVETCNAAGDEDCDGMANEEGPGCTCVPGSMVPCYTGPAGTLGMGVCKGGMQSCGPQGMPTGPCMGEVTPVAETCNTAVDDDCDGQVNEDGDGCTCVPGSSKSCYSGPAGTLGVGTCKAGTETCNPDGVGYGPCVGEITPAPENCSTPANEDCLSIIDCGTQYWAKTFGAASDQQTYSVVRDAQNYAIITGRFTGMMTFGGNVLLSPNGFDIFVAKFDAAGNHVYSRRYGDGSIYQEGFDAAVDTAGNVFVTGYFDGTINFGGQSFASGGLTDIFLVKLDVAGQHLWSKTFPAPSPQYGDSLAVDSQGNVIIAAAGYNTIDFGGGGLTSAGNYDIYVAKLDGVTGAHIWSKRFGSANDDRVVGLAVDSANNVVFTAYSDAGIDFGGGVLSPNGSLDAIVVKLDSNGNWVWNKRFGDGANQFATELVIDAQDNVIVSGGFEGSMNFGGGNLGATGPIDAFVAKLTPAGNHVWSKGFGGAGANISLLGLGVDPAGNVAASGSLEGSITAGGTALTSVGAADGLVMRLAAANGNLIWARLYGGQGAQTLSTIAPDGAGDLLVSGYYEQTIDFGGGNLTSTGSLDIPLAKLAP